ncbi:MAG: hypothetical protein KH271_11170 [Clostridiales bacterium]|nr:hypothetical protein [Clostridiales bacterium]MBS6853417.1 hypothetical protein [Clostridiales bacterium]
MGDAGTESVKRAGAGSYGQTAVDRRLWTGGYGQAAVDGRPWTGSRGPEGRLLMP